MADARSGGTVAGPLICADLELSRPQAPPDPGPGVGIELLVRLRGQPLGLVRIAPDRVALGPNAWVAEAEGILGEAIAAARVAARGPGARPPVSALPRIAIVIATVGERDILRRAISAALQQDYAGEFEVIVVDNAPGSGVAAVTVASLGDPRLRLVEEPERGVSKARNTGSHAAVAAGFEVISFTDDDALADPGWLSAQGELFASCPAIAGATGLVLPGSLVHAAERFFESATGFNKGFERRVWSLEPSGSPVWLVGAKGDGGPLFPFAAGQVGSGNNMSFRAGVLEQVGGFDPAMGVGTPTRGGEDLDLFFRVLASGGSIVYEPRALVRHFHRASMNGLREQMFGYGSGLSAYLFREFVRIPRARVRLLRKAPSGAAMFFGRSSDKANRRPAEYPRALVTQERRGFVAGPALYLQSWWRQCSARRSRRRRYRPSGDRGMW